jgi:hypothetical protein
MTFFSEKSIGADKVITLPAQTSGASLTICPTFAESFTLASGLSITALDAPPKP